jgi:hypothetical protein
VLPASSSPAPATLRGQALAFARGFYLCALRPALTRAFPLQAAVWIIAHLVMEALPIDLLVARLPMAPPVLAAVWALAFSFPRAAIFGAPGTEYLRSLPVPTPLVSAACLIGLLLVDVPFVALCLSSGDPGVALAGPALSLAVHTAASARRFALPALALLVAAPFVPRLLIAPAALALAAVAAPVAFNAVRVGRGRATARLHLRLPLVGLTRALLAAVVLADGQLVRRALLSLAVAAAVATLAVRNNAFAGLTSVVRACLVVLALFLPGLTVRLSSGVLAQGWNLGWLLDATGAGRLTRTASGLGALLVAGGLFGAVHGLAVALLVDPSLALRLALLELAGGAALAVMALGLTALAVRSGAVDATRLLALQLGAAVAGAVTLGTDLRAGLTVGLIAALAGALVYHLRVVRPA